MCESKRVLLINSKNAWHKLFTHRLKTPSEKSQNRTKRDDAVSHFFSLTHAASQWTRKNYLIFDACRTEMCFPFFFHAAAARNYGFEQNWSFVFYKSVVESAGSLSLSLCVNAVALLFSFCFAFFLHRNLSITIHLRCVTILSTANPTLFFIECFLFLFGSWSMNRQARSQHIFLSQQF